MIKCLVIDDEPLAVEIIETYIAETPYLQHTASFTNPLHAKDFLEKNTVDLVFLDIQMPQITGIELVRNLEQLPLFIFTTAYPDYALEGFELNASDYLVKPIPYNRFLKAAERAKEWYELKSKDKERFIFVKSEYENVKLKLSEILFIEGLKDYLKIFTTNKTKATLTLMSFKDILQKLQDADFIRVHRSYIVNKRYISGATKTKLRIGQREIPIGNTYRTKVLQNLKL